MLKNYFDLFVKNNEYILNEFYNVALKTYEDIIKYDLSMDEEKIKDTFKINMEELKKLKLSISTKTETSEEKNTVYLIYNLNSEDIMLEVQYESDMEENCEINKITIHDKKENKVLYLKKTCISILSLKSENKNIKANFINKEDNCYFEHNGKYLNLNLFEVLVTKTKNLLYKADMLQWKFVDNNIDDLLEYFLFGNEVLLQNKKDIFYLEKDIKIENNFELYKIDIFNMNIKKVFLNKKIELKNK